MAIIQQGGKGQPVYVEFPFDLILDFKFGSHFAVLTATSYDAIAVAPNANQVSIPQFIPGDPVHTGDYNPGDIIKFDTTPDGWAPKTDDKGKPLVPSSDSASLNFTPETIAPYPPDGSKQPVPPAVVPPNFVPETGTVVFGEDGAETHLPDPPPIGGYAAPDDIFFQSFTDSKNIKQTTAFGASIPEGFKWTATVNGFFVVEKVFSDIEPIVELTTAIVDIQGKTVLDIGPAMTGGEGSTPFSIEVSGTNPFGSNTFVVPGLYITLNQPDPKNHLGAGGVTTTVTTTYTQLQPPPPPPPRIFRFIYLFNFAQMARNYAGSSNDPTLVTIFASGVDAPGADQFRLQIFQSNAFSASGANTVDCPVKPIYDQTRVAGNNGQGDQGPSGAPVLQFTKAGWTDKPLITVPPPQ
jgi:hypothetical protein